jgi:FkbH-like protein
MLKEGSTSVVTKSRIGTLLELSSAGRLATEYPLVRELLEGLSEPAILQAGRLLARVRPDEILRHHPKVPSVTIAITGHGTLSALIPALTAELARHGLVLRSVIGDYNSYVVDLGDPASGLYAAEADLVLCVLDPAVLFEEVPLPWTTDDVQRAAEAKLDLIERLVTGFEARARGGLVLNTMPLLRRYSSQLIDYRSRARLGAVWREANARLLRLPESHPAVTVVDMEPLLAVGIAASDARLSTYAKAHFTVEALSAYSREIGHLARQVAGLTKKCLVLDLDGTLWGGVLGDGGIEGIEIGDGYRGEAFLAFQRVVKQIGSQGVLVAAISKNEPELVGRALREHPRMALREGDFVQVIADWRPKHENLAELAERLGLGADSFVFLDDSVHERELIRRELPKVAVVDVDEEPALHIEKLLRDGWFDIRELTVEDRTRARSYQAEQARRSFLDSFSSIEVYLRELRIRVRLGRAAEKEIPRISQLTLRTNQFNMVTHRLQPSAIRELIDDPSSLVLSIHASDRFGDNGLVGVAFLRRADNAIHIDNFMLSCRVFSRGIEQACLARILGYSRTTGATTVFATYRPTSKNHAVASFYPRYGFSTLAGEGDTVRFRHTLEKIPDEPEHVNLIGNIS